MVNKTNIIYILYCTMVYSYYTFVNSDKDVIIRVNDMYEGPGDCMRFNKDVILCILKYNELNDALNTNNLLNFWHNICHISSKEISIQESLFDFQQMT